MGFYLADTITPFLFSTFTYLVALNALIAVLEGILLRRWFRGGDHSIRWMLLANYLSAWIGWVALVWLIAPRLDGLLGPRPIERVELLALLILSVAFAITVVVEFGVVHVATSRSRRSWKRSLLATISVNLVSYLLISLWFCWTSFTLPFNVKVRPLADLKPIPNGTLYWIDPVGNLMAENLSREGLPKRMGNIEINDQLEPWQLRLEEGNNSNSVDMRVRYSFRGTGNDDSGLDNSIVLPNVVSADAFPPDYWENRPDRKKAADLRTGDRSVQVVFDWYRHVMGTTVPNGPTTHLCVGLATFDWMIEEPTILPDDKIVFEWGGQIVLLDPHMRKLAFIAMGTCPCFVPSK